MSTNKDVFTCVTCGDTAHRDNTDEMVFANGNDIVHSISEQYPDWTHCYCGACYDKQLDELQEQMEDERLQAAEVFSSRFNPSNDISQVNWDDMNIDERREHLIKAIDHTTQFKAELIRYANEHPEDHDAYRRVQTQSDTLDYFEKQLRVLEMG